MKRLYFLIIYFLLVIINHGNSQSDIWEFYDLSFPLYEWNTNIKEINDNRLLIVGSRFDSSGNQYLRKQYLRIHDPQNGRVIKEAKYEIDSLITTLEWIFTNKAEDTIIVLGGAYKQLDTFKRGYLLMTIWDEQLNLIEERVKPLEPVLNDQYIWHFQGLSLEKEHIFVGVYSHHVVEGPGYSLILKFKPDGTIIQERQLLFTYSDFIGSIEERIMEKGYVCPFVFGLHLLDNNFEIIDTILFNGNPILRTQSFMRKLSSNSYLLEVAFEGGFNPGIMNLNKNFEVLEELDIGKYNFVGEGGSARRGFDWVDTSSIFMMGWEAFESDYYILSNFNSDLDLNWIRYMGENDEYGYWPYSLVATQDGGCVLVGTKGLKRNYTIPEMNRAWAIKFDAEGNTVSAQDTNVQSWSATVFPNPSPGFFKLRMEGEASESTLQIVDVEGRKVAEFAIITLGENRFDLSALPTGIYVWQLMRKGKLIGSGKWVKE